MPVPNFKLMPVESLDSGLRLTVTVKQKTVTVSRVSIKARTLAHESYCGVQYSGGYTSWIGLGHLRPVRSQAGLAPASVNFNLVEARL